jgi:uridine kinase
VDPQRKVADIIVPRGVENQVAMCELLRSSGPNATNADPKPAMVVQFIQQKLLEKSTHHRAALKQLEIGAQSEPLSKKVMIMEPTPQLRGMNTILHDIDTSSEDFIFYFDRLSCLLIEQYGTISQI